MFNICKGNISKDWPLDNMKRTGSNGSVCYFSADHYATAIDDILDTYNYLVKINDMV